jgi:hypothetical protein
MYVGNLGLQLLIVGINISSIFLAHFVCVAVKQRRELDNPRDDELCSVLAVNK